MNFPSAISPVECAATLLFGIAILHTFFAHRFQRIAGRFKEGTFWENLFHLLGEVEVVFGIWAAVLVSFIGYRHGFDAALHYVEQLQFTEPLFVFAIITVAATRPVIQFSQRTIIRAASILPFGKTISAYFLCLFAGPLLGSFITEP